jgi:uncharacterized protein involved in type VI secretion and phage assembly
MAMDMAGATLTDLARRSERLFGKYRAIVSDNKDPQRRGRLQLIIPSVFGAEPHAEWVQGAFALGGHPQEAAFLIPAIDSHILVEFIEGDKNAPVWTASYFPQPTRADVAVSEGFDLEQGQLQYLRTRSGIEVRLEDDGADHQMIVVTHPKGAELRVDAEGIVSLQDGKAAKITLDPVGDVASFTGYGDGALTMEKDKTVLQHGSVSVELAAGKVSINADSVMLGNGASSDIFDARQLAAAIDQHTHPVPSFGTSGPPVPPLSPQVDGKKLFKVKGG